MRTVEIQANRFFQLLSDHTRLRCLLLLQREGELCVCELTHALALIQPKISRHLATLRDAGVVIARRQGQWIYYHVNPALPGWALDVIRAVAVGTQAEVFSKNDRALLAAMPNRPAMDCCL